MNNTKLVPNAVVIDDFINRRSASESSDVVYNYGQMRYKCKASGKLVMLAEWQHNSIQPYSTIYPTGKKLVSDLLLAVASTGIELKPITDTRY